MKVIVQRVEPGFSLLREEPCARKDTVVRYTVIRAKPLPRYVERDRSGRFWFRVDRGARIRLPNDPASPEFKTAYSAALVDASAAEVDDDWRELQQWHDEQAGRALR
jgi:hypothetical protein